MMDLIPENVPKPFVQPKDRWARKFKDLGRSSIALIEVNNVKTWRWRYNKAGKSQDWPYSAFSSFGEFEKHVKKLQS